MRRDDPLGGRRSPACPPFDQQCRPICSGRLRCIARRRTRCPYGGEPARSNLADARHSPEGTNGSDGLIVNLLDSKLAAPNPDFLSYTLSKQALAGFTELSARALSSQGIRVNGIAPALMLRSAGQTDENYERVHSRNPLHRGVEPDDVVSAIRYLVAVPTVTGEVLVIDGGQRFSPPARDVQFLED